MRALFFLASLALSMTACGGSSPAVAPASPPTPGVVLRAERQLNVGWSHRGTRWNHAVAIAPTKEVLVDDGEGLEVRAAEDGKLLRSAPLCSLVGSDALRFADARTLVAACRDQMIAFTWPELTRARSIETEIAHVAIGADRIATIAGRRRVRLWNAADLTLVDWFDVAGEAAALALSPDGGRLAIATDEGLVLRDVAAQTSRVLYAGDARTRSLAFSPDGRRIFTGARSAAIELDAATGGILRSVSIDSWVTAVRYLSDDAVAVTGARGLRLVEGRGEPRLLDGRLEDGLDVASDGSALCAGGREGQLKCFSASGYQRLAAPPALAALPKSAPPPETNEPLVAGPRAAKPTAGAPAGTTLAWSLYGDSWRIAIAPSGELVSASGGMLQVHSPADGHVVGNASLCRGGLRYVSFVAPGTVVFICDAEAGLATFPAVKVTATYPINGLGERFATGGGRLAFETATGKSIRVVTADGWKPVDDVPTAARLEALTLSPDGKRLAYAIYDGGVIVRDLGSKKETVLAKDAKGDGLAFSPDGARLFALTGAFQAAEFDVASGTQKRAWHANTWITEAHYLTDDTIVAAGAGGLTVFTGIGGDPAPSIEPYGVAVAVGADATTFCASGNKGELACFRRPRP